MSLASRVKLFGQLSRINRPIGIWLLFVPCLFGIFLAKKSVNLSDLETARIVFLFLLGSVLMRSAGCIINDLFDQKFDEQVVRTKLRPLVTKEITRFEALALLAVLLVLAALVLLQFNLKTIVAGLLVMPLVVTYPLMKRFTYYPQIFLGVVFNFGVIIATLALAKEISVAAVILYFSCVIWTVIYDTIYAYQDIEDDLRIGVKSTAIRFRRNPKVVLYSLAVLMFFLIFCLGFYSLFRPEFFFISLVAFLLLAQQIRGCDFGDARQCLVRFKNNFWIGILILTAIIFG